MAMVAGTWTKRGKERTNQPENASIRKAMMEKLKKLLGACISCILPSGDVNYYAVVVSILKSFNGICLFIGAKALCVLNKLFH